MPTATATTTPEITAIDLRRATADDAAELRALARRSGELEMRGPVVLATRGGRVVAARSMRDDVLHFDRDAAGAPAALDAWARRARRRRSPFPRPAI